MQSDQDSAINSGDTGQTDDEKAVRKLLQQLNQAWGDADAFGEVFTEDADYVVFDGSLAKGRKAIVEMHRPLFEGFLKGSRLAGEFQPTTIRFLAPDVAFIHSSGAVLRARQQRPSRRALSVQTLVAVKQEGRWLFRAFQNTRYRPFAQTLLGKVLIRLAPRERKE